MTDTSPVRPHVQLSKRYPPRYRGYFAIIVLLAGYLLFQPVVTELYLSRLPAPALLTCTLEAVSEGRYDDGEHYLLLAQRKAPHWEMTDIARHVFYWHEGHDYPLALRRFEWLAGVPGVNRWLEPHELAWRDARENRAQAWMKQAIWPANSLTTKSVAGKLFDECWSSSPHEVEAMTTALLAMQRGDTARAWTLFAQLAQAHPQTVSKFYRATPLLLRNYALAARLSGHHADAERLAALFRQQPVFRPDDYGDAKNPSRVVINPARDRL